MSKIIAPLTEVSHLLAALFRMGAGMNAVRPDLFIDHIVQD
jgi:hypothetical protein